MLFFFKKELGGKKKTLEKNTHARSPRRNLPRFVRRSRPRPRGPVSKLSAEAVQPHTRAAPHSFRVPARFEKRPPKAFLNPLVARCGQPNQTDSHTTQFLFGKSRHPPLFIIQVPYSYSKKEEKGSKKVREGGGRTGQKSQKKVTHQVFRQ